MMHDEGEFEKNVSNDEVELRNPPSADVDIGYGVGPRVFLLLDLIAQHFCG